MTNRPDIDRGDDRGSLGDERSVWQISARTHVGLKRTANQDRFLLDQEGESILCAVADGMGGPAGGETASRIALERFAAAVRAEEFADAAAAGRYLERGAVTAHDEIRSVADSDPDLRGMGTTLVGLAVDRGERGSFVNVGDSRLYRMRRGELSRLSYDHSVVADLVRRGEITSEEAAVHPRRNVLTMALGVDHRLDPQVEGFTVEPGDIYLLSSDGLHGMISDRDIARILAADWTVEARCSSLVEAALDAGGSDNVTVVLLERSSKPVRPSGFSGGAAGGAWLLLPLALLALLVMLRLISTDGRFDDEQPDRYPVDSLMQEFESEVGRGIDTIPDSLRGFPFARNRILLDSNLQPTPGDIVEDPELSDSLASPADRRSTRQP